MYGYGDDFESKRTDAREEGQAIAHYPLTGTNVNSFGIYDMTGGALEWTSDVYRSDITHLNKKNPANLGDGGSFVARGGAYLMQSPARRANCVYRYKINIPPAHIRNSTLGFRCAIGAE